MTAKDIQNKLDQCLNHIQTEGLKNLPQVIHDLDYLMNQRHEDEKELTLGEQFLNSSDFYETTQTYYLELIKQYTKDI